MRENGRGRGGGATGLGPGAGATGGCDGPVRRAGATEPCPHTSASFPTCAPANSTRARRIGVFPGFLPPDSHRNNAEVGKLAIRRVPRAPHELRVGGLRGSIRALKSGARAQAMARTKPKATATTTGVMGLSPRPQDQCLPHTGDNRVRMLAEVISRKPKHGDAC